MSTRNKPRARRVGPPRKHGAIRHDAGRLLRLGREPIAGNTITGVFSGSLLASTGFDKLDCTWNLWPRDGAFSGFAAIADFAESVASFSVRRDDDRRGRASRRAVEDGLDVVAVRIEHEGRVVTRVVGALARRAVVAPAGVEGGAVEGLHNVGPGSLERQVDTRHRAIGAIDVELVGVEVVFAFDEGVLPADRCEHRTVETPARVEVRDPQVHVVDQSADVELHLSLLASAAGLPPVILGIRQNP
jgi:hypothetical protein